VKPWLGVALAAVAVGAVAAAVWLPASQTPTVAKATPPLSFAAGESYTVTVTLSGAVSGDSTTGSVQTALPSTVTVTTVTATPTSITIGLDALSATQIPTATILRAVAAPAGSLVNVQDQGPTTPAASS
jgi:hypothetical protein